MIPIIIGIIVLPIALIIRVTLNDAFRTGGSDIRDTIEDLRDARRQRKGL
jgi:hypothetical protein